MNNILDEPTKAALPTTNYGYYASRATILLVMTIVFIMGQSSNHDGYTFRFFFDKSILVLNGLCTFTALVTSVFSLTHREPDASRAVVCLVFSAFVSMFWFLFLYFFTLENW